MEQRGKCDDVIVMRNCSKQQAKKIVLPETAGGKSNETSPSHERKEIGNGGEVTSWVPQRSVGADLFPSEGIVPRRPSRKT